MFYIQYFSCENKKEELLSMVSKDNNYDYLSQDDEIKFPLLSDLEPYYANRFFKSDMKQLISELETIQLKLKDDDKNHVDEILLMCRSCNVNEAIIFNPFGV